ncbi:MAG: hypothetical protein QOG04_1799 [Actinomycetota bacterium]|jgi:hypothetical protein|nr:hypothetical protein [Actinomycetota bacterium]
MITTALLSVLLVALVPTLSGAAARARSGGLCAGRPTAVHSFHVEAEWTKKTYKRSEMAEVTVTVTRPAHEDPAGGGTPIDPPTSTPEKDVTVGTTVITERYPYPYGYGSTDANGQVHFKIPLNSLKPGSYDVSHYADKWTNRGGCPDIQEWGYLKESPGFKVVR